LASQINASNSGFGGIVSTGDSSGVLQLQAAGTTIATIQSTGLNLGSNGVVFSDSSSQTAAASPYVLKNRIINGDMRIDQRNAGASVTPASGNYTLDRWFAIASQSSKFSIQQNAAAVTPPSGFNNYLGITSLSAYSIVASDFFGITQRIEGFNIADLDFGTANAKTVTLSFWVRSSLTGTFGGSVTNSAGDRSYPFTYTISSANTWEQKTVTIAGETSGTWITNNGVGMQLRFGVGVGSTFSGTAGAWATSNFLSATGATSVVGTNGATFYITGVQLEIGTSATPFERRLYNQELANCQRYYWKDKPGNNFASLCMGSSYSATTAQMVYPYKVTMRSQPTLAVSGVTIQSATTTSNNISSLAGSYVGYDSALLEITTSGFTARNACWMNVGGNGSTAYVEGSAEL